MQNQYPNHPLRPLHNLLLDISTPGEFTARRDEILDAIHLAEPILDDRTPELRSLANQPFLKRRGAPTTPRRMAYLIESRIKETLDLTRPKTSKPKTNNLRSLDSGLSHLPPITYRQLRSILPTLITIPTLGGRAEIEIHNPAGGYLMAVNSKGNGYPITEADWNNARAIRARNPRNPWKSAHYTGLSEFISYGLNPATALLRAIEEGDLASSADLEAA